MSGPKSYSVSVFDKRLSNLFHLQTDMQCMIDEIRELSVSDGERNIECNCDEFLSAERESINELLQPFNMDYTGRISQRIYNDLKFKIKKQTQQLEQMVVRLKEQHSEMLDRRADYNDYVTYDKYYERLKSGFDASRSQLLQHLNSLADTDFSDEIQKVAGEIGKVDLSEPKAAFSDGFQDDCADLRLAIQQDVESCGDRITALRTRVNDQLADLLGDMEISMSTASMVSDEDLKTGDKIRQIERFIAEVEDEGRRHKYSAQLKKLSAGQSSNDAFYFIELFDEIRKSEKTQSLREEIQRAVSDLSECHLHSELEGEKADLVKTGSKLMGDKTPDSYQVEDFQAKAKGLLEMNRQLIREHDSNDREKRFIKDQVIKGLKSFNYKVMEDMNVVDFEKQGDFLLKAPNQDNYLNLRFNKDGSLLYNFLIPEEKESLSIDEKRKKLDQMDSVCGEFKTVLKELSEMGVKVDLEKELPISEKALIKVPAKYSKLVESPRAAAAERVSERERRLKR